MKQIVSLILLGMFFNNTAQADDSSLCEELSNQLATFAGAATAYQMTYVYGGPTTWVAAGLYAVGAGLAAAGVKTSSEAICENLDELVEAMGESYLSYACGSTGVCTDVDHFAASLAHDFAVCPSCAPDEIFGAIFMVDDQREHYLRQLQNMRNPEIVGFGALHRDHLGIVDPSVLLSYHLGTQSGAQQRFYTEFVQPVL